MNIIFNPEKIKSIISDFANITGINIWLTDCDRKTIARYEYNTPEFCMRIHKTEKGINLCKQSDFELFNKCKKMKTFTSSACHAGITDSVMPIIKDEIIVGYIILGRIRKSDNFDDVKSRIENLCDDAESLKESYLKLPCYSDKQMESIARLMSQSLINGAIILEYSDVVKRVTKYIEGNLSGDLSVRNLCRISHSSKNTLYRHFDSELKTTLNKYITKKRIEKAKMLLKTSDMKIYEIAEATGMNTTAQFSRTFKKLTGYSPLQYKKEGVV